MRNRIIVALDTPSLPQAQHWVDTLSPYVGGFKVGLELFISEGSLPKTDKPIVLDLKLYDIPRTVRRAVEAGVRQGVKFMTLHVQQEEALHEAMEAAEKGGVTLLGVTLLTSMTQVDCTRMGFLPASPRDRVLHMAQVGYNAGLRGFVCSPEEVSAVRAKFGEETILLVPGIRPVGGTLADQKRVGTPKQAVKDGASLLVIGRPITEAADMVQAVVSIGESMA